MSERVGFYIDGFNLFCGLSEAYGHRYKWLDLGALCASIIRANQSIELIHYCTAPVKGSTDKSRRQREYWDALESVPRLRTHLGFHQKNKKKCRQCHSVMSRYEEKQTDSRIAALMVADAMADRVDTLILIAGDSDHVPAIEVIKSERPGKGILVCWPPKRKSEHLRRAVGNDYHISEAKLRKSVFPLSVPLTGGGEVVCPEKWRTSNSSLSAPGSD